MARKTQDNLQAHLKRLWIHGFLMGFGVVSVILLTLFFVWGWPTMGPEGPEEPKSTLSQAPATPETKPAPVLGSLVVPPPSLKEELETVLARMVEANQKKDLPLLLSLYDSTFPDLPGKTKEMSRTWSAYDYPNLQFRIEQIKSTAPGEARARVVWRGKTRNRATGEIKDLSRIYLVEFSNHSGQWRIKHLKREVTSAEQKKSG